ncbi:sterol methyltransferase [Nannochloropsis oceanica]
MGKFTCQEAKQGIKVDSVIDDYNRLQSDAHTTQKDRNSSYSALVNAYYDLATLFYEWGWGQSFHFANQLRDENFKQSIRRHEYYLASRLDNLQTGASLLDCGCGVGGPMRNISRFTGAKITGVTINKYQVTRGNELNAQAGLEAMCKSVHGDFMALPFPDCSFDGVYAIEATCHAPDRTRVFAEIFRVLKPGQNFACYEWCLTDKYDKSNPAHRQIKKQIEEGDGLPDTAQTHEMDAALKQVGFTLIESKDMAVEMTEEELNAGGKTWYHPLTPSYNVLSQRFQFTPVGMPLTTMLLKMLEFMRLAPTGTSKVQTMLQQGAIGLAKGGEKGIFTPMYLCVARKPLGKE